MTYFILRPWANGIGGTTAVTFALMALPIFAVSGFAIDASRQVSVKKHVQEAADAAALAGARTFKSIFDETEAESRAANSFEANIASAHADAVCRITALSANVTDLTVRVEASCTIPTLFGVGISGKNRVAATVTAQAVAVNKIADVAMMFDVSDSMGPVELGHLKDAGQRAAQIIIGTQPGVRARMSVVPFATGVNAGDFGNMASGRLPGDDTENDDSFGFGGLTKDRVCVTERVGREKYTDASPIAGQYVGPPTTLMDTRGGADHVRPSFYACPNSPLHPLDSNLARVNGAIAALAQSPARNGGNTAGHMGIAWSWYTISPNWSSVWTASSFGGHSRHDPHPYGDPRIAKVAILMTDGAFQHGFNDGFGDIDYNAQQVKVFAATQDICSNMRSEGITIYAIGYNINAQTLAMLTNCAGDVDRVYTTADSNELVNIYQEIAAQYLGVGLTE